MTSGTTWAHDPAQSRRAVVADPGHPDTMRFEVVAAPEPGPHEFVIEVRNGSPRRSAVAVRGPSAQVVMVSSSMPLCVTATRTRPVRIVWGEALP